MRSMSSVSWERLPDGCLVEILKWCDGLSILQAQLTCSRLLQLGREVDVWVYVLRRDAGYFVPEKYRKYSSLMKLYRNLVLDNTEGSWLQFRGVLTDGGMQDDQVVHWVNNLFHEDIHKFYCSSVVSQDVLLMGVHTSICHSELPMSPLQIKCVPAHIDCGPGETSSMTDVRAERSVWYHEESVQSLAALATEQAKRSVVITKRIMVGRMGFISCPVMSGVVFIGDANVQCSGSTGQIAKDLYESIQSQHLTQLASITDMESLLCACSNGVLPSPKHVVFDSMGEWAEFGSAPGDNMSMAPVVWFKFYSRSEYLKNKYYRTAVLGSQLSCDFRKLGATCNINTKPPVNYMDAGDSSLTSFTELLAFFAGGGEGPAIDVEDGLGAVSDGEADSVEGADDVIRSIPQYFVSNGLVQTHTTRKSMKGRDYMEIELTQPAVGNAVCMLMNSRENMLHEFGDLDRTEPNIDANIFWLMGKSVEIE